MYSRNKLFNNFLSIVTKTFNRPSLKILENGIIIADTETKNSLKFIQNISP